jgi:ATP-binding cassette subfamily B protein
MERGRVVEVGRHDDLVDRPQGVYARLHAMQLLEGRRPQSGAPLLAEPSVGHVRVGAGERGVD